MRFCNTATQGSPTTCSTTLLDAEFMDSTSDRKLTMNTTERTDKQPSVYRILHRWAQDVHLMLCRTAPHDSAYVARRSHSPARHRLPGSRTFVCGGIQHSTNKLYYIRQQCWNHCLPWHTVVCNRTKSIKTTQTWKSGPLGLASWHTAMKTAAAPSFWAWTHKPVC